MGKFFEKIAVTPKIIMPIVERNVVKQLDILTRARNELTGPG